MKRDEMKPGLRVRFARTNCETLRSLVGQVGTVIGLSRDRVRVFDVQFDDGLVQVCFPGELDYVSAIDKIATLAPVSEEARS